MKLHIHHFLTVVGIVLIGQAAFSQSVNSGAWQLGGSLGFNSLKEKGGDYSETFVNLSPNVGYYPINNLGVGVRLSWFAIYYGDSGFDNEDTFGIGPWARYYIVDGFYGQAGIDFGPSGFDIFSLLQDDKGTNFHFGAGYSFFLNNSIAIEPQLEYNIYTDAEDGDFGDYNRISFNIGIQAFLGRNSE